MKRIVRKSGKLELERDAFVVEAIAKELDPEWVRKALRECGRDSIRKRLLPASFMVWFVILLGLFRRNSYFNLLEKVDGSLWTFSHWPKGPPTTRAVTKARDRLGVEPMRRLYERAAREWIDKHAGLMFHGRRVFACDGSTYKTADSEENARTFGRPGAGRGRAAYPQMRAVTLTDVGTRIRAGERHAPYGTGEVNLVRELLPEIPPGALVIFDRNFLAYDVLWDLHRAGADFLVRVKDGVVPRLVRRIGRGDALVEVTIPRQPYRKKRPDMPRTWRLRMITYRPERSSEVFRLFSSQLDTEITKKELAQLYHDRWEEETVIDEFKTHLCGCSTVNHAVVFRSKTPERVEQEWYGLLLAQNAVHATMASAVSTQRKSPRRLSFTSALERIREATYEMSRLSTEILFRPYRTMLKKIRRATVPLRRGRKNPRCVRIKMSNYPLKEDIHVA